MRVSSLIAVAAATAPLAVSAAGTLGYALGARHPDGTCKSQQDYEDDFDVLNKISPNPSSTPLKQLDPHTENLPIVRTYAQIDGAIQDTPCSVTGAILPAAQAKGFKVVIGLWAEALDADINEFHTYAKQYESTIHAVTVGSESLYRYYHETDGHTTGLSNDELNSAINTYTQAMLDLDLKFPVGTADSWNVYNDGTADNVIKNTNVSILLVNAFGYWQNVSICNASLTYFDDLTQAYTHINSVASRPIELWNGETGWPTTAGASYGGAVDGINEAYTFFKQGVCALLGWNKNVFYFEAFDEPWKPASTGLSNQTEPETGWGLYNSDRTPKFPNNDYSCTFDTMETNPNILC
ncbi:MAG: glycoside hydrolase 3 protein [Alectoria sarmentosa]|nr:MAG: glycoside hydrolase 3 protein [Alectoria sarmentosa]